MGWALIFLQALLSWGFARAQTTGFLSIDCGADTPYIDDNGIQWIPDEGSMNIGEAIRIGDHVNPLMSTMRVFKGNQSKYCYNLTSNAVKKGAFFLVRASFWPGSTPIYTPKNSDGFFHFKYVIDGDEWRDIRLPYYGNSTWFRSEAYIRAQQSSIYYCLARSVPDGDAPFISALALRPLPSTIFAAVLMNLTGLSLATYRRFDYAGSSSTMYPDDSFDRVWYPFPAMDTVDTISTTAAIDRSSDSNVPPVNVLQTAFVGKAVNNSFFTISFNDLDVNKYYFGQFHFAEIDPNVTASEQRMFNIYVNGELWNTDEPIDIMKKVGAKASYFRAAGSYPTKDGIITFNFSATSNSSFPPLLCAAEFFRNSNITSFNLSSPNDVSAIEDIKYSMNLSIYTGDPCLPTQYGYSWLECTQSLTPTSIPRITSIFLSNYSVTGVIPNSISTLTMLNQLLLDGNDLRGPIPDFSDLRNLTTLKLSNNNLNGSLPKSLATLKSLKVLHLQNNNLSGVIPSELLDRKKAGILDFEYFGNPFLCEEGCNSLVLPPTSSAVASKSKTSKTEVIAGAGVSIVVILLVLSSVIFVRSRRNKNLRKIETLKSSNLQHVELHPFQSPIPGFDRPQPKPSILELSFDQIMMATSNFTTHLGKGRFGNVFKGKLEDERIVAIKVASSDMHQQPKEFVNEVEILSRVHHKNLVNIVGYCKEKMPVLIYEFMSNGSLYDCLHGTLAKVSPLPWSTRLSILVDAAQGLDYLHHGCNTPIIHRDVKSSNILLNDKMEAKISDFGISRDYVVNETTASRTALMGTTGYIDPEYLSTEKMTRTLDVYSFGVLIFEVVCGRKPVFKDSSRQEVKLVEWVNFYLEQDFMEKIIDGAIEKEYHVASMWSVLEIAKACVQIPSKKRPEMSSVYHALKNAKEMVVPNLLQ